MLKVSKITIQYLDHPVGLGGQPWFGWKIESDRRNVIQEAYRLEIGTDASCFKPIWQSGWVNSQESAHVAAEGFTPESCCKYYVRVQIRDGVEAVSYTHLRSCPTAGNISTSPLKTASWNR